MSYNNFSALGNGVTLAYYCKKWMAVYLKVSSPRSRGDDVGLMNSRTIRYYY